MVELIRKRLCVVVRGGGNEKLVGCRVVRLLMADREVGAEEDEMMMKVSLMEEGCVGSA